MFHQLSNPHTTGPNVSPTCGTLRTHNIAISQLVEPFEPTLSQLEDQCSADFRTHHNITTGAIAPTMVEGEATIKTQSEMFALPSFARPDSELLGST
jgi:hypothetical protein